MPSNLIILRSRVTVVPAVVLLTLAATSLSRVHGQQAQTPGKQPVNKPIGGDFIPADAMATAVLNPAKILSSDTLEWYPTEVVDAWCQQTIGVRLSKVQSARVVVAAPGPNDALFAAVFQFTEPVAVGELSEQLIGDPIAVDGYDCRRINGPPGIVVHQWKPDAIVLSSAGYLRDVLDAKADAAAGPLAELANTIPHSGQMTVLFALEPVRPMINAMRQALVNQVPPPLAEFATIPDLLQAISVRVDLENKTEAVDVQLRATDVATAEKLEKLINQGISFGRQIAVAQMQTEIRGEGTIPNAMRQYVDRMADGVVKTITPRRDGTSLHITSRVDYGITTPAVLISMLMPVVRTSRIQVRGARDMNNLKQLGLAMHNHHSAYKELPGQAIQTADGTALLSWRVKVLPFIEEQALYEKFRLDEPWDSEHNLDLLDEMPDVFRHPQIKTKPGFTVYQVPVNPQAIFRKGESTRFREVLDGLSNTLMVVETTGEQAVPWTKPADWEFDLKKPFAKLNFDPAGNFNALFADGAVLRLRRDIGEEMMAAILTIAGGELVTDLDNR